ncbi:MAG: hypothetical protein KDA88_09195 [Planctomycetaceae bacterium]|nr:hypothetical protein [Planctomycetaceae bacterium]MCB9953217.1 hypothetical protein [Planctomycetaceae bacterium]
MNQSPEAPLPADPPNQTRRWWLILLLVLFAIMAGILFLQRDDGLQQAVEAQGGHYYEFDSNPFLTRYIVQLLNRRPTRLHWIHFFDGGVDDEWLIEHADEINDRPNLLLTLRDPAISDAGLAPLASADVFMYDLQGSSVTDASLNKLPPSLQYLNVARTNVTDAGVQQLVSVPTGLTIDGRQLTENSASTFTTRSFFNSLQILDATNESIEHLSQISVRHELVIQGSGVTSESLPAFKKMPKPQRLVLIDVSLADKELDELRTYFRGSQFELTNWSDFENQQRQAAKNSVRR